MVPTSNIKMINVCGSFFDYFSFRNKNICITNWKFQILCEESKPKEMKKHMWPCIKNNGSKKTKNDHFKIPCMTTHDLISKTSITFGMRPQNVMICQSDTMSSEFRSFDQLELNFSTVESIQLAFFCRSGPMDHAKIP